ncbi:telo2 interacting protein 1 [Haematobia irritans]|uniref:telo2 interacting protein 1 n=1 Tax=Haematobia irritans TaxID=7368 RepID=UPI003F5055FD
MMSSLEPFVNCIKPAMDTFLRQPTKEALSKLENELAKFNWMQMNIFNIHILVPLVLKLDELSNENQYLRIGCLECITLVTSNVYLKELTALRTMLVVILKQIRHCDKAVMRSNVSEELKLASIKCMSECLRRSTTDVLEQFYTKDSSMILGQVLLTLVDVIENEKYKKIVIASLECLMIAFYVHDEAERMDVVLRNQVANVLFIFLPKIVTVLYRTALADERIGESIKITSLKAMSRIMCVIYEETVEDMINVKYDTHSFKRLFSVIPKGICDSSHDDNILAINKNREQLEMRMKQLQDEGRTWEWIQASSKKLRTVFIETNILRSHTSTKIRQEYAQMCAHLIQTCAHNNLRENFILILESVVAFTEDDDIHIRNLSRDCIERLQSIHPNVPIFDESAELLFDEHMTKLPRIIQRYNESEQYSEFIFLKGFLKSLSPNKLQLLFSIPKNLEMFCMCLLSALELNVSIDLLDEEYTLRDIDVECDYMESNNLPWRRFKHMNSERCVKCVRDIFCILGRTPILNRIVINYFMELLQMESPAVNEILLVLLWLSTAKDKGGDFRYSGLDLVKMLLSELLDDKHWHLSLEPDQGTRLKNDKHTDWFVDRTPGLYESAVEVKIQDCDSDDEIEGVSDNVTIADAEFNVLHTCLVMDCLGHCALYIGERFDSYIFQSLPKVLLKLAHSNIFIYKSAIFALVSIQKALRLNKTTDLIEINTDYISYHLNTLLKKSPDNKSAVDIFTVILQFSSRNTLPYMETIFQTIYEECSKAYETMSIISYLKVFNAFLRHITKWLMSCDMQFQETEAMDMEHIIPDCNDCNPVYSWLALLQDHHSKDNEDLIDTDHKDVEDNIQENQDKVSKDEEINDKSLPRHVEIILSILQQVVKFINSSDLRLQILSVECLTRGLPLLKDYENELLPLVHLIWTPFVEKFRQRNALVLNRCFSLLEVLAIYAKDFLTKRSLDTKSMNL